MSIQVNEDGSCVVVDIKKTAKGFSLNRRALHVHHSIRSPSITLASPVSLDQMRAKNTQIFQFQLPPPLNCYIYPTPIYAIQTAEDGSVHAMTIAEFESICSTLGALALKPHETAAVYDVPAIPFNMNGDDEAFEEEDDYENENIDENSDAENTDDDIDDDEDWQDDEDDIGSTT